MLRFPQCLLIGFKSECRQSFFERKPADLSDLFLLNRHIRIIRLCKEKNYCFHTAIVRTVLDGLAESVQKPYSQSCLFKDFPFCRLPLRFIIFHMAFTNGAVALLHQLDKVESPPILLSLDYCTAAFLV